MRFRPSLNQFQFNVSKIGLVSLFIKQRFGRERLKFYWHQKQDIWEKYNRNDDLKK